MRNRSVPAILWMLVVGIVIFQYTPVDAAVKDRFSVELLDPSTVTQVDFETGRIVVQGPLRVTYGSDVEITADALESVPDEGWAYFEGHVVMHRDGSELTGAALRYDLRQNRGELVEAAGVFKMKQIQGPVFVSGQRVETDAGDVTIEEGRLTTCGCEKGGEPGYYLSARRIDIVDGDVLTIRNVRFVESGMTLFWWPYLRVSLKRLDRYQGIVFPEVGYSSEAGWYVKTGYHYGLRSGGYGLAHLDYYQLKGWGTGVDHTFWDSPAGWGRISAYRVNNPITGIPDLDLGTQFQWEAGSATTLDGSVEVKRRGDTQGTYWDWTTNWHAGYEDDAGSVDGSLETREITGAYSERHLDGSVKLTRSFGSDWKLRGRLGLYDRHEATATDLRYVDYLAELTHSLPRYDASLAFEERVHPDLKDDESVPWFQVARLPELTLRTKAVRLFGLDWNIRGSAGYGRFHEQPSDVRADRGRLRLEFPHQTLLASADSQVSYRGDVTLDGYSTGDQRLSLQSDLTYTYRHYRPWLLRLTYTDRESLGATPFHFDSVTPTEKVTGLFQLNVGRLAATIESGYDFLAGHFEDVTGRLLLHPSDALTLNVQGSYSMTSAAWGDVLTTVELAPEDDWRVRLGARYDPALDAFERIDGQLELDIAGNWQIQYAGSYNALTGQFDQGDLALVRDLDCRTVTLRYNQPRQEIWLEYKITAFPQGKVSVGSSGEELLFDADGWLNLLND